MMELIFKLVRLMGRYEIAPQNIRITVEFLGIETQSRAEAAIRMNVQPWDGLNVPGAIEGMMDGKDFRIMGLNFRVKKYERPHCDCAMCKARLDAMR